jgi:hypothetical protein
MGTVYRTDKYGLKRSFEIEGDYPSAIENERINNYLYGGYQPKNVDSIPQGEQSQIIDTGQAIITGLVELLVFGAIGALIAYFIWPKGTAKKPSNTARQFAAFVFFVALMSVGGGQVTKYGFSYEVIVTSISLVIFFTLIGGALGWLYGRFILGYPVAADTRLPEHEPNRAFPRSPASRNNIQSMTDTEGELLSIVVALRRTVSDEIYGENASEIRFFAISAVGTFVRFYGQDKVAGRPAQQEADRFLKAQARAAAVPELGISEDALLRKVRDRFTEYNVLIEENFRSLSDGVSGRPLLEALDRHVLGNAPNFQVSRAATLENILTHTAKQTKDLLEKDRQKRAMKPNASERSDHEDLGSHAEHSPPRSVARQAATGARVSKVSSEAWSMAVEYHPEIKGYFESLQVLDPDLADRFRATVLEDRDFQSAAAHFYERLAEAISQIDLNANPEASFLAKKLAERGELDALAELLKISRLIGFSGDWLSFQDKFATKFKLPSEVLWDAVKAQKEAETDRLAKREREQREDAEEAERLSGLRAARQERLDREEREEIEYQRRRIEGLAKREKN